MLSALVDYYEILADAGEISKPGYCMAKVSYALSLSVQGELLGILPLKVEVDRGKKKVEIPQTMEIPEKERNSNDITSNFLCDNITYLLGVDYKAKPERAMKCFHAFRSHHHEILDEVQCPEAKAVLRFIDHWSPELWEQNTIFDDHRDGIIAGANLVFHVEGIGYVHESSSVRTAWELYKERMSGTQIMNCLITGQKRSIARLHPTIYGVYGAQSMGLKVVSFDKEAYESYGKEGMQGLNAPVSEYAAFSYTTALNHLLASYENRQFFGDTTIIYWAKSAKTIYADLFSYFLNPSYQEEEEQGQQKQDKKAEALIHAVFKKIVNGGPVDLEEEEIDQDTKFYILGVSPNAARLAVRLYLENSFGSILSKIKKHYQDLSIEHSPKDFEYLPLWKLLGETVPANVKTKEKAISPLLSGAVLRSIFSGSPYPEALYNAILLRIRAEKDITRAKAAIIKACLIRKDKMNKYKEDLAVSLNKDSKNKAYVLGQLFSVLEKAQKDANPGIKATIKDRYFSSACATPGIVFPNLLRLSNYHTAKAEYGKNMEWKKRDLLSRLEVNDEPFPVRLNLEEQGLFILGYYHQDKDNYVKKDTEGKENE